MAIEGRDVPVRLSTAPAGLRRRDVSSEGLSCRESRVSGARLGPAGAESGRSRLALPLVTFLAIVVVGGWYFRDALLSRAPHVDEATYLRAAHLLDQGGSPYGDRDYLYTPVFAVGLNAAEHAIGPWPLLVAFRCACLTGFWLLVWASLAGTRWPWPAQGMAALALLASPVLVNGIGLGNASLALIGPLAMALLLAHRRPALAGAVLGTMNAFKPLGLTAMAVLVTPEKGRPPSRWAVITAGAAVAAAVPWLLVGREHLPAMLRQAGGGRPEWNYNLSLHRVLFALGLPIPASLMFLLVTGIAMAVAWRWARGPRQRMALATAATVLALPVNNPHSFLLSLPVQALALERAVAAWREARRQGEGASPALARLVLVAAAIYGAHTATGAVSAGDLPLLLHGLVILIPLSAVAGLTWYALGAPEAVAAASPDAVPWMVRFRRS
jgi:hypothetical protein